MAVPPTTALGVLVSLSIVSALSKSLSSAHPSGVPVAVHKAVVVPSGAVELVGSPPPPTLALLTKVPLADVETFTGKLKMLVPAGSMAVGLVQVITLLVAEQAQFAD